MIVRLAAFVLPLGLDTLAISIALGIRGAPLFRAALTFGARLGERFASYAGRIAGIAFILVGIWIAHSAVR